MKNSAYWQRRFALLEEQLSKMGQDYYRALEREYRQAIISLKGDIAYWYVKFAKNNEISYADAKKMLDAGELEEFKWTVDEYIRYGQLNDLDGQWTKQLINASSRVHISRYTALQTVLQNRAEVLAKTLESGLNELGRAIYAESYYRTAYEIQKGLELGWQVGVDENRIKKVLSKPWTADDKTFSDRIWLHKEELLDTLDSQLTQTLIRGDSPDKAIQALTDRFEANKNQAARLVMTESAFFSSAALGDCFNALGVEKYRIVATLDLKTSEVCRCMDGKVFDIKDYKPGETAHPFHPWCRTIECPHSMDGIIGERAARDPVTGKTYYVPADMTYKEWYQKYVIDKYGADEAATMQKMSDNETKDRDQYQQYKDILGKDAPKTFEDFQDLKYNDSEYFNYMKLDYGRRNELIENPSLALPNAESAALAPEKFTSYLFNENNPKGWAKGQAFTSRLGYSADNWKLLQNDIKKGASAYPATYKGSNNFGKKYEQKMVLYGENGKPANVVVGWLETDRGTHLTTAMIKEV